MARQANRLDLVGTAEAAEILDVERPRIGRWIKLGIMPEPVAMLRATPVWLKGDILKLKEERASRRRTRAGSDESSSKKVLAAAS